MHLLKQAWCVVAPRLKPALVIETARRLLASPIVRTLKANLRRRMEDALREGAVETLAELLRRVRDTGPSSAGDLT